ncbi:hypothetical protein HDU97_005562 [Phlyctochytrium planicorne]|nr:hypothetical protein HDU97_005562 [Phlyctochytrium planicorne]
MLLSYLLPLALLHLSTASPLALPDQSAASVLEKRGFTCPAPKFSCTIYANDGIEPIDAYHVRPKDIKSVAAIGDSVNTGFSMTAQPWTALAVAFEDRYAAALVGSGPNEFTIPNIIKKYSPNVKAGGTGVTLVFTKIDKLNAAITATVVKNLSSQVDTLAKEFYNGNYDTKGWKMINVLIGANNVCFSCPGVTDAGNTAQVFGNYLRDTMKNIQAKFPTKTLVNIVQLFRFSSLYEIQQGNAYCRTIQTIKPECPCLNSTTNAKILDGYIDDINAQMATVAKEFRQQWFAVNVQPALAGMKVDSKDYISALDCFHPNVCSNKIVAGMFWNNLFEKEGQKTSYPSLASLKSLYCPGPNDYIK